MNFLLRIHYCHFLIENFYMFAISHVLTKIFLIQIINSINVTYVHISVSIESFGEANQSQQKGR